MTAGGGELLGTAVLELRTDQTLLNRGLAQAEKTADASGQRIQKTMDQRLSSMSKSISRAGSELTRNVTLPIVGLGVATADMAQKFNASMEMIHTQAGATQREVNGASQAILNLAKSGQVAAGPDELSKALYRLESAGLRGKAALDAVTQAAQLAAVGQANVEDTAKALSQVWFTGIRGAGSFKDTVAQLNATVGAGDMRLQDLVDSLGTGVLSAARLAGLTLKDVTGAIAVFGDQTKNVSGFTTQFATALHFLTNPTQKADGALKSMHMTSMQLNDDLHKPNGLVTALKDLKDHLDQLPGGLHGPKAAQILGDILPGGRGRVLEVLLDQLDRLQGKIKQIAGTTSQYSSDVAATQRTDAFKIHAAWAQLQADAIEFGDKVLPDLMKAGGTVIQDVEKVTSAFMALPPGAQKAIVTGGLIVAGIGPALKVLGLFTGGISKAWETAAMFTRIAKGQGFGKPSTAGATGMGMSIAGVRGTLLAGSAENPLAVAVVSGSLVGLGSRAAAAEAAPVGATSETWRQGGIFPAKAPAEGEAPVAVPATEEAIAGTSLKEGATTALNRGMQGLLIGTLGVGASQAIGAAVHGSVGHAISAIGSDASIGAGLGAFFGPEGIAGGAIIGGLVGTFKHFFDKSAGQVAADSLSKGFGGQNRASLQKQVASSLDSANKLLDSSKVGTHTMMGRFGPTGQKIAVQVPIQIDPSQLSPEKLVQFDAYMKTAGQTIAKQLADGWNQYKFQSEPVMFTQLTTEIKALPPKAQAYAIQSAAAFMRGLESQGRVAKGSTDEFLTQIMQEFPAAVQQMGAYGMQGVKAFIKALDFSHAQDQLGQQLQKVENDFAGVQKAVADTSGSIEDKSAAAIMALIGIEKNGTAPMRKQAAADIAALRSQIETDFDAMEQKVSSAAEGMSKNLQQNSHEAMTIVVQNYSNIANAVYGAMQSGALNSKQGAEYMDKAFIATLKAFGAKPIPPVVLQEIALSTPFSASVGAFSKSGVGGGGKPAGAAGGGLWQIGQPGQAGYDSVPMNVGGMPIMVAPGEQVAVFNRHQLPVVNAALSGFGGLPGLFDSISTPHYMATGGTVPRFAGGGALSYGQLEQLWVSGGGPPSVEAIAAAIAMAESRGQDVVQQGQPYATTGVGYWQITPGGSLDPLTNAQEAVAKYHGAGDTFRPWTTYMDGAYRAFLQGGVAPQAAAMLAQIVAPKVHGSGAIAGMLSGSFGKEASAANAYLANLAPMLGGASGGGVPGVGAGGFSPSQLGTFQGLRVADWIIRELLYAQAHGWKGRITSAYRSGFDPMAPSGSEHAQDIYPGGAVDFGGMVDPTGLANKDAFFAAAAGYPSSQKLIAPIGFRDDGHASGTGHARGGILRFARGGMVPGFAGGGFPSLARTAMTSTSMPRKYKTAPKQKKPPRTTIKTLPSIAAANPVLAKGLSRLNGLLGDSGQISTLQDRYTASDNMFNATNPNLQFVVTSDPVTGQSVAPYIDWDSVNLATDHYNQLIGWEQQIIQWYHESAKLIPALVVKLHSAIAERQAQIDAIKGQILANLAQIAALQAAIKVAQNKGGKAKVSDQIAALQLQLKKLPATKANKTARAALSAQIAQLQYQGKVSGNDASLKVSDLKSQITGLEGANKILGGTGTSLGTGGQLGTLAKQITSLQGSLSTAQQDQVTVSGLSGIGGALGDANVNLVTLNGELSPLGTSTLAQQLVAAQANYSPASTTADSTLIGLLQQQNTTLAGQYAVSQAQYKVLSALPPFGGSFAAGGMVPGPVGAARMALVHGGEKITPVGGDGGSVGDLNLHAHGNARALLDLIDWRIESNGRQATRTAKLKLPGRGGGQLLGV